MLANEALEPFNDPLTSYAFEDAESPNNPVRFTMKSAAGADDTRLLRRNVIWTLYQLPLMFFDQPSIWGTDFMVRWSGVDLYIGRLDNRNSPTITRFEGKHHNPATLKRRKRTATAQIAAPNPNSSLTLPALKATGAIDIQFFLRPSPPLPATSIFRTILNGLFTLAVRDIFSPVSAIDLSQPEQRAWIYIMFNNHPAPTHVLRVYQVIALLQAIAQFYIGRQIYQELTLHLVFERQLVAAGCVTRNNELRRWCAGMGDFGVDGPPGGTSGGADVVR